MTKNIPNEILEITTSWDGGLIVVDKPNTKLIVPERYGKLGCRSFFFSVYGAITIPETVRMIGFESFDGSVICTELKIPDGCVVEDYAFVCVHAERLVIGKGVKLSVQSFYACEFTEIVFEDKNDIIEGAFDRCWCGHAVPKNSMEQESHCSFPDWIVEKYPQLKRS